MTTKGAACPTMHTTFDANVPLCKHAAQTIAMVCDFTIRIFLHLLHWLSLEFSTFKWDQYLNLKLNAANELLFVYVVNKWPILNLCFIHCASD